ncbi:glucosamine 6-phosphate N-acetyltransferase-like [Raphidocelis subcapitata]|uniref:Glucosamine 6-phosphate N-acetyltransferase n=1 Tax=Raphidocelis subcapitata TaxID=307507 RepID=A0A2V0PHF1_9CHLO|nr:glucosamine 6-phosphate N-acetyltransferase-like [Raphidocelis subcapitata]|eukprot:GBF99254.1 glucosamine 6-phosphate N-acetyltransferase-like [Raphidocelis subcapitata]
MEIVVRQLEAGDYDKGFLGLLSQLTTVGDIDRAKFEERLKEVSSPDYYIAVAEDAASGKLLGTAALVIERKFIHGCGKVGHIEDVVVDAAARGQRLGQRLVEELVSVSRSRGCYKVILDCAEHNVAFYEKCGLTRKEVQMVQYLDR